MKNPGLTISRLQSHHVERQEEWCPDIKPDLSFRGVELGGECGEAMNVIKKLERERHGWRGSRATFNQLAEELADVVHCATLAAISAGIDLERAVVDKFNATSAANGLKSRIEPMGAPAAVEPLSALYGPRTHICWTPDNNPNPPKVVLITEDEFKRVNAALAAMPGEPVVVMDDEDRTPLPEGYDAARWKRADEVHHAMALVASDTECVKILYAALAAMPGEPVAYQWRSRFNGGKWDAWENGRYGPAIPPFMEVEERALYAAPPPPAEPAELATIAIALDAAEAEIKRLEKIIAGCDWFWPEGQTDSDSGASSPLEVLQDVMEACPGEVFGVQRGGVVETLYCAFLDRRDGNSETFVVEESTPEAAEAKIADELAARAATLKGGDA